MNDPRRQQDGPICHEAKNIINLLKESFSERIISHPVPVA